MRRYRVLLPILFVAAALALAGCSVSLPQGTTGYIALIPFWDEEQGIQGVRPLEGWTEKAELVLAAGPGSRQDVVALILAQTDLTALPESTGAFTGKALTWDLYSFESSLADAPVDDVHIDVAIAATEADVYLVALPVLPDAFETNPALYKTVFRHVLYALEPLE
jgi:hypothetical protein